MAEKSLQCARLSVLCASLVSFGEREEDIFLYVRALLSFSFDFSLQKKKKTREKRLLSQLSFSKKKKRYIEHVFELEEGSALKKVFLQCRGVVAARLRRCSPRRRRRRRRRV